MVINAKSVQIIPSFVEGDSQSFRDSRIDSLAVELLRLSNVLFGCEKGVKKAPASEIKFLAEVILQLGQHDIPGFDPCNIADQGYKTLYEAAYGLVHSCLRHPQRRIGWLMTQPVMSNPKGLAHMRMRNGLLRVLHDRKNGVYIDLTDVS